MYVAALFDTPPLLPSHRPLARYCIEFLRDFMSRHSQKAPVFIYAAAMPFRRQYVDALSPELLRLCCAYYFACLCRRTRTAVNVNATAMRRKAAE